MLGQNFEHPLAPNVIASNKADEAIDAVRFCHNDPNLSLEPNGIHEIKWGPTDFWRSGCTTYVY